MQVVDTDRQRQARTVDHAREQVAALAPRCLAACVGLREPVISWGVLLTGVQNIRAVALAPWLFLPGVAIIVTVLAFNFVGDGLRDAADPYSQ